MTTTTTTTTMDSQSFLRLMWLASPALPVGAFSYSEGLEAAIDAGLVKDEPSAAAWLQDQLALTQQRSELPCIAHAMQAWRARDWLAVQAVEDWHAQTRECAEQRAQSQQMGRSLMVWLAQSDHAEDGRLHAPWPAASPSPAAWSWPVAFALAAVLAQAATRDALLAAAFGWAENMVQAAVKAVPLGQAAAQRILRTLLAAIPTAVDQALAVTPAKRQSFAPRLAILGARHEAQYARLFRS